MTNVLSVDARGMTGTVHERPWGSWDVLDRGECYQVKRLTVLPHSRLSLQTHRHRSEHWLVVAGTATCVIGAEQHTARTGTHVFVPQGAVHRLTNARDTLLQVVEVQHGSYLEEDDIVRLQDDHGRA